VRECDPGAAAGSSSARASAAPPAAAAPAPAPAPATTGSFGLGGAGARAPPSTSFGFVGTAGGGGQRLGGAKPKPSELIGGVLKAKKDAEEKDSRGAARREGGGGARKEHARGVAASVEATPGLAQLCAMGFSEEQGRAALRRAEGNVERAIEALLRGA